MSHLRHSTYGSQAPRGNLSLVFYAERYHPVQAGSIDGTDTAPHDRGIKRALQAYKSGLCKENMIELVRGLWWERVTSHAPVAIHFGFILPSRPFWLLLVTFGYLVGHPGMHFVANVRG